MFLKRFWSGTQSNTRLTVASYPAIAHLGWAGMNFLDAQTSRPEMEQLGSCTTDLHDTISRVQADPFA